MSLTNKFFKHYLMALVLVIAAYLLRLAIENMAHTELPTYITFYPVVMIGALVGGLGPGLLATAASAIVVDSFIITPYTFLDWNPGSAASLILFSGMGIFMTAVAHHYRRIRDRMEALVAQRTHELKRANDEWELTFNNVPDLITILDDRHRIMRANRALADHLKLEPAQCIGLPCYTVMHGTSSPPDFCPHLKSFAEHAGHTAEVHGTSIDSSFHVSTTPLFSNQGIMYATVHVARDITKQKENENTLRENKEKLQLFIEYAPAALAMFDREMRYIKVSKRWLNDFGLGDRNLLGLSHYEVFPEIPAPEKEAYRLTLEGEVQLMEADRFRRADGTVQWLRREIRPWYDAEGNPGGIVIFSEDVTEQKQTEEVLRFLGRCGRDDADEDFFHELARYLAQVLSMDFASIDLLEEDQLSARTLAVYHNGTFEDNISYILNNTPHGDVVGKRIQSFPRNVRELFPDDTALRQLQAESYLGATLWSAQGEPIGLIALIGRQPLANIHLADSILQVAAVRAAGELERQQVEEALYVANNELEQRVVERTERLAETVENQLKEMAYRETAEKNLRQLNRLYAVLSETNQTIVRTNDRNSLFQDFCRIAVNNGGFLLAWVGLVDEESGHIRSVASFGATSYLDSIRITRNEEPSGLGPTDRAVREGTYYICNDFQNDSGTKPWHERALSHGIRASASVALKEGNRVTGALTLYAAETDFFDQHHARLLVQMGEDISFALDFLAREERRHKAEKALREETLERLKMMETLREKEKLLLQQSRNAAMGEMIGNIAHQWRQPLNTLGLSTQRLGYFFGTPSFNKELIDTSVAKSMEIIQYMSRTIDDFRDFFSSDREKIEFRADEAVMRALSLVEASFKEHRIDVERVVNSDVKIFGFPNEYSQVLLNILINAKDAINERNIPFPRLKISIGVENGTSVVSICDNAGGIPTEIIDKIFDPYFSTKGPQQGTGVGLFMSKTIIENNMGGMLSVRNTDGGAEFRIEV